MRKKEKKKSSKKSYFYEIKRRKDSLHIIEKVRCTFTMKTDIKFSCKMY